MLSSHSFSMLSVATLILCIIFLVFAWGSQSRVTICRTRVSNFDIITLSPSSWLSKNGRYVPSSKKTQKMQQNLVGEIDVREIMYIPSHLSLHNCDAFHFATDDEHFCSLLCDCGFVVHVINTNDFCILPKAGNPSLLSIIEKAVEDFLRIRAQKMNLNSRNIALMGCELSVFPLLHILHRQVSKFYFYKNRL